ncbi:hypothetical protein, partial [Sandarakinorhabdus oryzae]|uniref:hypothetical protein n=1 Tax=Sandarakinorhabdus oryzae TaxID=2675220 RepID=UPI001A9CACA0
MEFLHAVSLGQKLAFSVNRAVVAQPGSVLRIAVADSGRKRECNLIIAGKAACVQREGGVGDQPAQPTAGAPSSDTPGRGT